MTRRYEMMVILESSQSDEDLEKLVEKISEMITSTDGGEMVNVDKWGKKRLAYEIKGKQFGYYVVFEYNASPEMITEFERSLRFDNNVVRHMILQIPPKVMKLKEREEKLRVALEDRRRRMADESVDGPVVDLISYDDEIAVSTDDAVKEIVEEPSVETAEESNVKTAEESNVKTAEEPSVETAEESGEEKE